MKDKKKIGRREFLKVAVPGAAVTTAALYGCKPRSAGSASEADGARQGQMTYRTNPKTGERVSLLGYGMEEFEARYIDNGMLDFLLAEREAGRIRNLGFSYHGDIAVFDHLLAQHDRYKWDFVQIQLNYVDWKHAKEVNTRNTDAEYLYGELSRAAFRPSSWNRCWAAGSPMCRAPSSPVSSSASRR